MAKAATIWKYYKPTKDFCKNGKITNIANCKTHYTNRYGQSCKQWH